MRDLWVIQQLTPIGVPIIPAGDGKCKQLDAMSEAATSYSCNIAARLPSPSQCAPSMKRAQPGRGADGWRRADQTCTSHAMPTTASGTPVCARVAMVSAELPML